jgi:hypothetical protein
VRGLDLGDEGCQRDAYDTWTEWAILLKFSEPAIMPSIVEQCRGLDMREINP